MALKTRAEIFAGPFTGLSAFTAFRDLFNLLIAGTHTVSAEDLLYLDGWDGRWAGDGVLDEDDRDWWLDKLLRENLPYRQRLPFGTQLPTTYAQSDPLDLVGSRPDVVIIDPINTGFVNVRRQTNQVYAYADLTGGTSIGVLWGSINGDTTTARYNTPYKGWRTFHSGDEGGSSSRRRMPMDGAKTVWYLRGGVHDIQQTINISKQLAAATHNSRITIRAYPGERVQLNFASENQAGTYTYQYGLSIVRPNVWLQGDVTVRGYIDVAGIGRVFAPLLIAFDSTGATTCAIDGWKLENNRCIAPDHPDADDLPHYVDDVFASRASKDTVSKMMSSFGLRVVGNGLRLTDFDTRNLTGEDFPASYETAGGGTTSAQGESVDLIGVADTWISHSFIGGHPSHQAIRMRANGSTPCTNMTLQESVITTYENTCLALEGSGHTLRRFRLYNYSSGPFADDGHGMQISADDSTIEDFVVFNLAQTARGWGLNLAASASGGTRCKGLTIRRGLVYRSGTRLGWSSGTLGSADAIYDNAFSQIVFCELPEPNKLDATVDGVIAWFLRPTERTRNTFTDVMVLRLDASTRLVSSYEMPAGTTTYYTRDTLPGAFVRTVGGEDPYFVGDAASGDFRVAAYSRAASWLANAPLVPFEFEKPKRPPSPALALPLGGITNFQTVGRR